MKDKREIGEVHEGEKEKDERKGKVWKLKNSFEISEIWQWIKQNFK